MPASLYYVSKPAWWPVGTPWPWAGADLAAKVGALPAQISASAFNYKTSNNPNCTPNVGEYSCP
jgi:hypothetical protein